MKYSHLLATNRLEPSEFLNRIVYKENGLDFGLLDVTLVSEIIDDDDEIEQPLLLQQREEDSNGITEQSSHSRRGLCVTCNETEPAMCVLPCFHFCICEPCWIFLQQTKDPNSDLKCPACGLSATDAKKMNFV